MTTTKYITRSPIYGYSGCGYDRVNFLEKSFDTVELARKNKRRCNKAFQLGERCGASTDLEDRFYRHMTDTVSFSFQGETKIVKRTITVIEEEVN